MQRAIRVHRLDAGMRGWIVKTSKKNYWRVPTYYQLEDLIQDGMVTYAYCNRKYQHVTAIAHFMSLVKVSFLNHIHDLSNERTLKRDEILVSPESYMLNSTDLGEAFFTTLLGQLPVELKHLVMLLASGTRRLRRRDGDTRETTNEFLCRLLAVDPSQVNIMEVFQEHLA